MHVGLGWMAARVALIVYQQEPMPAPRSQGIGRRLSACGAVEVVVTVNEQLVKGFAQVELHHHLILPCQPGACPASVPTAGSDPPPPPPICSQGARLRGRRGAALRATGLAWIHPLAALLDVLFLFFQAIFVELM